MIQSKRWELSGLKKCREWIAKYDSLLERNYMWELENMWWVISWTKDHWIKIPYRIFWLLPRKYLPDFLVTYADWTQEIHETKWAWFLAWASTHAKRIVGDDYCRKRNMKYRFIENSWGAFFVWNNTLDSVQNTALKKNIGNSFHDL